MSNTEKKFIDLAMDYLIKAKDQDKYSSYREECLNVALAILDTLLEEEEDGRGQMD